MSVRRFDLHVRHGVDAFGSSFQCKLLSVQEGLRLMPQKSGHGQHKAVATIGAGVSKLKVEIKQTLMDVLAQDSPAYFVRCICRIAQKSAS